MVVNSFQEDGVLDGYCVARILLGKKATSLVRTDHTGGDQQ
ncbi:MAG: hypothetical protein RBT36_10250 [Desulfobulbus sp.]|jgi:hypothetical protein|nr:hypothetical protein [Desulfobulbus sp.]